MCVVICYKWDPVTRVYTFKTGKFTMNAEVIPKEVILNSFYQAETWYILFEIPNQKLPMKFRVFL